MNLNSVRAIVALFLLLTVQGTLVRVAAQTPRASEKIQLSLTAHDRRAALIPAGSTEALIDVTADPSAQGGDLIDVVYFVPNVVVTLIMPDGTEVGSENAAAHGFSYGVIAEGAASNTPFAALLSSTGTHTLIQLPQSAPHGVYKVKVTTPAATTDTPVVVTYISSSRVQAGLTMNAKTYRVGDTVTLMAVLLDDLTPITGATVNAEIIDSSSGTAVPTLVALTDSGSGDAAPGDGIYTGSFTANESGQFVAAIRASGASEAGVSFSRSASAAFDVTSPLANFVSFQNGGVDEDADQLIDKLVVTATVDIQKTGDYKFSATLLASNGAEVKADTTAVLSLGQQQSSGQHNISLQFPSKEIIDLQAGGPYKIKDAALYFLDDSGAQLADYRAEVGETAAYPLSSFRSPLRPDLAITAVATPDAVKVNDSLNYKLVIYNVGAASASDVTVFDQLPSGTVFVSAAASQGTCNGSGPVSCVMGTLESGSSATVDIVVTLTQAGAITNTAEVTRDAGETNTANNSAEVTTNVAPPPPPTPTPIPTPVPSDAVTGIKQIPGYANGVDVSGKYVYVAAGEAGLQVLYFEPDREENLELVGSLDTPGNANGVKVVGNRAYVADGSEGLQVIDISSPTNPVLLNSVDTPGEARKVAVNGSYVYVADGSGGLQIIDTAALEAPAIVGSVSTTAVVSGVDVSGDFAVTIEGPGPLVLRVVNVSDPATPQVVGELQLDAYGKTNVAVSDGLAYVAAGMNGVLVVDFSDPVRPQVISTVPPEFNVSSGYTRPFWPCDVKVKGGYAAASTRGSWMGLIDLQDPTNPQAARPLDTSSAGVLYGLSVAMDDTYVYTTADAGWVSSGEEQGATGDTWLVINQYRPLTGEGQSDSAGVAPTVTISAPQAGQTLMEGGSITLTAEASDDVQVAAVQFSVNGIRVATDYVAPYQINYRVPLGVTALSISASAVDLGGNTGTSSPVVVNVIPDPPPTVSITSPAEGEQLVRGQSISIGVDASDNIGITEVRYKANGETLYGPDYTVPSDIESLTIEVTAVDNLGRTATATRTLSVIPDPGTTVTGVVSANGHPVVDATVTLYVAGGYTVQTGADGTFTMQNVPTMQSDIAGEFYTSEFGSQYRQFEPKAPVRGGVTDLGALDFFPQYTTTLPEVPSALMNVKDYNSNYVEDVLLGFPNPRSNVYLSDYNGRFTPDQNNPVSLPGLIAGTSFGDIYGYANQSFAQLSGHPGVVTYLKTSTYFGNQTDSSFATGLTSEARFVASSSLNTDRALLAFLSGGTSGPQELSVRFDDLEGGFTAPLMLPLEANTTLRSLKLADVTGDGLADILAVEQVSATDARIVVYPRATETTFGVAVESPVTLRSAGTGTVADDFAVGIFVSDSADIAVLGDGCVRLYRGDTAGSFESAGELLLPEGATLTGIAAGPKRYGDLSTTLIVTAKNAGAASDKLLQIYKSDTNSNGERTLGTPSTYTYTAPASTGDVRIAFGRFNSINGYDVVLVDGETLLSLMDILPEGFGGGGD